MRKICSLLAATALVVSFLSCEKDSYDAPEAGVHGQIVDHNGEIFQTAMGQDSMKIQIAELSYAGGDESMVVTNQNLNMRRDGSYSNSKLFAGIYRMLPLEGAFYPYDVEGETVGLRNGEMTECNSTVTPYLELEWAGEPYMDEDNFLCCSVKFKRIGREGMTMPDVNNLQPYISHMQYCGAGSDGNYTPGSVRIANDQESTIIDLKARAPLKYSGSHWVRVDGCCNDIYKKYDFTDTKKIDVELK